MIIPRDRYLEKLSQRKQNGMIKVVTGMRRAGKSFLLMKLFHKRLVADGVPEDHILEVSLDDRRNHALRDPDAMLDWISKQMKDKLLYVLLAAALFAGITLANDHLPFWGSLAVNTLLLAVFCAVLILRDFPLQNLPLVGKYFRKA